MVNVCGSLQISGSPSGWTRMLASVGVSVVAGGISQSGTADAAQAARSRTKPVSTVPDISVYYQDLREMSAEMESSMNNMWWSWVEMGWRKIFSKVAFIAMEKRVLRFLFWGPLEGKAFRAWNGCALVYTASDSRQKQTRQPAGFLAIASSTEHTCMHPLGSELQDKIDKIEFSYVANWIIRSISNRALWSCVNNKDNIDFFWWLVCL